MILTEYSQHIKQSETLTEKLNHYHNLNERLGLYNDEDIIIEWLPSEDNIEQILIRADNEIGLLTVKYNCNHRITDNIIDVKLNAE